MSTVRAKVYKFCVWAKLAPGSSMTTIYTSCTFWQAGSGAALGATPVRNQVSGPPGSFSPNVLFIDSQWRQLCHRDVQPPFNLNGVFALNLNFGVATIYIDDVSVESELLDVSYMEPDNLAARLESHRKGDFTVRYTNAAGQALPAGTLAGATVQMQRHDFMFGTAYDQSQVSGRGGGEER